MDPTTTQPGKPRLDEDTFQKLLAAAYVIQEHRNKTQGASEAAASAPGKPSGNGAGQASAQEADYASTLAEIVETQHQIVLRHLDLDGAVVLVAEQTQKITSASGAAVCLLDHEHLVYRAVSGIAAVQMGQALPRDHWLSTPVLTQGIVLRCGDLLSEPQAEPVLGSRAGIQSFLSVPIFHDDQVAGALELVFAKPHGYQEHDVRTCQLMAGLVTEALTRTTNEQWKKSLTAERDSMLEALEKLKPQLDRLAKDAEALSATATPIRPRAVAPPAPSEPARYESVIKPLAPKSGVVKSDSAARVGVERCHRCGREIAPQEVYCGNCGTLRADRSRGSDPGKAPSGWDAPDPFAPAPRAHDEGSRQSFSTNLVDHEMELPSEVLALTKDEHGQEPDHDLGAELMKLLPPDPDGPELQAAPRPVPVAPPVVQQTPQTPPPAAQAPQAAGEYPWTSAANAREWLNSVSGPGSGSGMAAFLAMHRGDISLGAAILALLIALFWGMSNRGPSVHSQVPNTATPEATDTTPAADMPATANPPQGTKGVPAQAAPVQPKPRRKGPDPAQQQPELSFAERALVALGLAEAPPPAAQYEGNPEVTVWVDLHTALYYCPSSELYGRTPKGKYLTQHQAQIDQFQPASRKVCE